jgi:hypothetical protein
MINLVQIQEILAYYLNKLKVRNPLIYIVFQVINLIVILLLHTKRFSFETYIQFNGLDEIILGVLVSLAFGVNPRTTYLSKQYENKKSMNSENNNFSDFVDPNKD